MKQFLVTTIAACMMLAPITIAHAGQVMAGQQVDIINWRASGSTYAARHSMDKSQSIGCETYIGNATGEVHGRCYATDASGQSVYCWTKDERYSSVMQSVSAYSYIVFNWNTSTRECIAVSVKNSSETLP